MPGMDGFETAAVIRKQERTRDVPIIFVTAGTISTDDTRKGYAHGAFDYLTKPLNPDALRAKVAALVDLWRRGESIRLREAAVHERERTALRSAIRQTEAELRLIIDGVRDHAISLLDPEGRVRTFNAPADESRATGWTRYRAVTSRCSSRRRTVPPACHERAESRPSPTGASSSRAGASERMGPGSTPRCRCRRCAIPTGAWPDS